MKPDYLPSVEIEPTGPARAAVIWLHGLGADGHDFEGIVPELRLPADLAVRFVLPHAPAIPVTINGGFVMPAWYDIRESDLDRRGDRDGLLLSVERVRALVDREEERGVPSSRIVVAGFSQGGAVALHLGLTEPRPLAGILGISTYLVDRDESGPPAGARPKPPIFLAHGTQDPMVPLAGGEEARAVLEKLGYAVDWHTYPMAHAVCAEEIEAAGRWLRGVLAPGVQD
jgi:phospholipase/carboxylesterase